MITVIRYSDKETIPIVGGFDWAYDLTPLHNEPINATGIAYSVHPYANKSPQPWAATWEENYGFAADTWPVFRNGITRKNANRFIDNLLAFSFYAICTTFAQLANRERKSRGIIPAILLF